MKTNKLFKITLVVVILVSTVSILGVKAFDWDPGPGGGGDDPPPDPDYTKPTVSITSPGDGALLDGNFVVRASASDNVGVAKVNFYIDGSLKRTDYSSSYTWSVTYDDYSQGEHTISAKAVDTSGNYRWDHVDVLFDIEALIIVEPGLWSYFPLQTEILNYKQDLNDQGFGATIYHDYVSDIHALRNVIKDFYNDYDICGAVLFGDLPYLMFIENDDTFICDLYLMDLDGCWQDNCGNDGIFDEHTDGSGDIEPEIYVGRIDASTRYLGGWSNIGNILDLLERLSDYRDGTLTRTHQALAYIDDDWKSFADGTLEENWPDQVGIAYPTRTEVYEEDETTATDWLNRLTQDYEWAHLCAHSGAHPPGHVFKTSSPDTVTSQQIHNTRPTFHFYNLFCCHGADFTVNDCLATTYLFSSDYSLAVVGSTKTGGMGQCETFYTPLSQGQTIGYGLHSWFHHIINNHDDYRGWSYGMCILGDPFLTI